MTEFPRKPGLVNEGASRQRSSFEDPDGLSGHLGRLHSINSLVVKELRLCAVSFRQCRSILLPVSLAMQVLVLLKVANARSDAWMVCETHDEAFKVGRTTSRSRSQFSPFRTITTRTDAANEIPTSNDTALDAVTSG